MYAGAADKEADEEEGSAAAAPAEESDDAAERADRARNILPLSAHPPPM